MKYLKSYLLFESEIKSKRQLKRELWYKNNPSPTSTIMTIDEVISLGVIPNDIIELMRGWDIIYKSPYSMSFYSANVSWNYKPDGCYRVSDHWNFSSSRDQLIHCKTNKKVQNNTHFSIGKYDRKLGLYNIILSLPTIKYIEKLNKKEARLKYLRDPDTISKNRDFKNAVKNGEIEVYLEYDGREIKGILDKYR